jgi:hypothetical protein
MAITRETTFGSHLLQTLNEAAAEYLCSFVRHHSTELTFPEKVNESSVDCVCLVRVCIRVL